MPVGYIEPKNVLLHSRQLPHEVRRYESAGKKRANIRNFRREACQLVRQCLIIDSKQHEPR